MDKEQKRISRYICLQIMYANEVSNREKTEEIIKYFNKDLNEIFGEITNAQVEFATKLYKVSIDNKEYVDNLIQNNLNNWDITRLALIDKLILRMAISEMFFIDDVPPKVSIAEGVEIAKVFSTNDSSSFVNGILDAVYNEIYIPDTKDKVK